MLDIYIFQAKLINLPAVLHTMRLTFDFNLREKKKKKEYSIVNLLKK